MSRGSRRRGGAAHGSDHPDERWLVSYADMITVLMCLFIVLFAMSNVDKGKYDELKDSLSAAFGREVVEGEPVFIGGVGEEGETPEPAEPSELTDVQRALAELQHLREPRDEIAERLDVGARTVDGRAGEEARRRGGAGDGGQDERRERGEQGDAAGH